MKYFRYLLTGLVTYGAHFVSPPSLLANWQPAPARLTTPWGLAVTPTTAWSEYPRPQFQRAQWTNLNGLWSYAVTDQNAFQPAVWTGEILVPFCPESSLSGVGRLIEPTEALWYRRPLPAATQGLRSLLNFEAVDYESTVWVNGRLIGTHTGGNTPFSFDITDALQPAGENELVIRVYDATEGYQLHGKQKLVNQGIWYTRVTGIWQTVWLEDVPENHLTALAYAYDLSTGILTVTPRTVRPAAIRVTAAFQGKPVAQARGQGALTLTIPQPQLWSPTSPHLYDLQVELLNPDETVADAVKAYTALRTFGKMQDARGEWQLTLNNQPIFHWGPLDQGWWPDGLLTPPSDAALLSDIEYLKAAGFNMIRKHIKVEPRRFYYHCDRLGMLVWQDQVSTGYGKNRGPEDSSGPWTRLAENPVDAVWPEPAHQQYVLEYQRMVDHLRAVPCIAVWSPFNEAWGQHRSLEVGRMAVAYDPTRSVNIASGGNFWSVGDIVDAHHYPDPEFPFEQDTTGRFAHYIKVVGEFGGHGLVIPGHQWNPTRKNFAYGKMPVDLNEWKARFTKSIDDLVALQQRGISAGVYTQTTDVENELNGLLTYDRVPKVEASWIKVQSDRLLSPPTSLP